MNNTICINFFSKRFAMRNMNNIIYRSIMKSEVMGIFMFSSCKNGKKTIQLKEMVLMVWSHIIAIV